jgi:hypothetical protein
VIDAFPENLPHYHALSAAVQLPKKFDYCWTGNILSGFLLKRPEYERTANKETTETDRNQSQGNRTVCAPPLSFRSPVPLVFLHSIRSSSRPKKR